MEPQGKLQAREKPGLSIGVGVGVSEGGDLGRSEVRKSLQVLDLALESEGVGQG